MKEGVVAKLVRLASHLPLMLIFGWNRGRIEHPEAPNRAVRDRGPICVYILGAYLMARTSSRSERFQGVWNGPRNRTYGDAHVKP